MVAERDDLSQFMLNIFCRKRIWTNLQTHIVILYLPSMTLAPSKIYAINSDVFYIPFVVLHKFYHHIRTKGGVHRGSEKHANRYAKDFIDAYRKIVRQKG